MSMRRRCSRCNISLWKEERLKGVCLDEAACVMRAGNVASPARMSEFKIGRVALFAIVLADECDRQNVASSPTIIGLRDQYRRAKEGRRG